MERGAGDPQWQGRRRGLSAECSEEHSPQGFSDERHGDVVVVRPMRDHTLKEVAFYNRLFDVPSVFTPAIDTKVRFRGRGEVSGTPLGAQAVHITSPLASVPATGCHSGVPVSPSILGAHAWHPFE